MSTITVCKNVIMTNNKKNWINPLPPIRIGKTNSSKAEYHAFEIIIKDHSGKEVGRIKTTRDGKPIVKCGAKVAIETTYPVEIVA